MDIFHVTRAVLWRRRAICITQAQNLDSDIRSGEEELERKRRQSTALYAEAAELQKAAEALAATEETE
jgi:hypothetical protein